MKRILLPLLVCLGLIAKTQVYNNEWINYSQTYYKFKITTTGLYRISQATLNSIGIGNASAENFQLWRNGQEIPLYTSVPAGPLSGSDYIEFWGQMNDGKPDKPLYSDPDYQLNDRWSLQTDTIFYFLTVNSSASNKRLIPTTNDIAGNTLSPEPYFTHTLGNYFKNKINSGNAALVQSSYVYSSAYDKGEGWTSGDIGTGGTSTISFNNLHVYGSGPQPTFSINAAGNAMNARSFRANINGTLVAQRTMDYYEYSKSQTSFSLSLISAGTASVSVINDCTTSGDRMVVAQYEISYPRVFDFDNAKTFAFELPANTNGNYLEITNFNYGSAAPVLYDITNGNRYVADISNPSLIRIALLPSGTNRKLILVSEDNSNINTVVSFQTRNFVDYSLAANQGNYLIITNQVLLNGSNGSTPVDDYRVYRSAPAGGGYNSKVYDIDQLVDQFAFGIKKHPLSVKNFIRYALDKYSAPPKSVFLIGKGVNYVEFRNNESNPDPTIKGNLDKLNLIPTFGNPASDNLLSCFQGNNIPVVPVGRLSVINADEVALYLKKVKEYESTQATYSPNIADKAWMKNVVHVVGADDASLQAILGQLMNNYKSIITDTLFGANVNTFTKTSADIAIQIKSEQLKALFQEGISLLLYFGHSSSSTLDFNLDDPAGYNNVGKYPIFIALGCNAGNLYNFNQTRLLTKETISEKFVLAPDRGSIAFLATTSLGIVQYLDIINSGNYKAVTYSKYDKTIGEIVQEAIRTSFDVTTQFDYYSRVHCEQISLNGDPALKYNAQPKPDYVIEQPLVKVSPASISVNDVSFRIDAAMMNMGKAVDSSIVVEIKRTYPNNVTEIIRRDTIPGIRYIDSISVDVPIVANRDKGLNKITLTIDADNKVDELYETNNSVTKDVFIYDDAASPVYPYNFSIVNRQNVNLVASTANPFASAKQYNIELDTTEFFNSPLKITKTVTSSGGVLEFAPSITFMDSTVYYWRVAPVPASGEANWNESSFIYLANSDDGFNQSHFYQHTKSSTDRLFLDSASRSWIYDSLAHNFFVKNGVFLTATNAEGDLIVNLDGLSFIRSGCVGFSLMFNLIDPYKFQPNLNLNGAYGSALPCQPSRRWNYEFSYMTAASRKKIMDFMDSIPNGYFVVVRDLLNNTQTTGFINDWKKDTTLYGPGNSLYHKLKNVGFDLIDSFNSPRAFAYIYQKNNNNFQPVGAISKGNYDVITITKNVRTPDTLGYISSPTFGPAKTWKEIHWRGNSLESQAGDAPTIDVYGIDNGGNETLLYSRLDQSAQDFDISGVPAAAFPYIRLSMRNIDSVTFTPYQLQYWRVNYVPVPEGVIAPNISFQMRDTVDVGEPLDVSIAFKNVSNVPFDSLKVKMIITDKNNVPNIIPIPRQKPLVADSTLTISTAIDTRKLPGLNNFYIDVNPDFDQPEQYLFNNFAYRSFYVRPDSLNPLMDVTFDGTHILNHDIVSSKPHILVKLKDEAKWMVLTDTSLLTIKVRFPDGSLHPYYFSNDTLRFTPAAAAPNANNTATIDFLPNFLEDGEYELMVAGKDMSNNQAGNIEYRVDFQVINKPMISNMLNYPNPFTTSTAFVFTLTGSEVPQNIKIEIMTVTGKIVREITKDELGPLHIGRNITEFKWDGTDQFGDKLANGIYLYRVVTNLNGKSLDKYRAQGDNTDKYFNKGYGKMYLMR